MAQSYFEESVRKDPDLALGYAGLAESYMPYSGQLTPDQAYRLAKTASQKALQLDNSIGEVHYALAILSWRFEWDFKTAEREFDEALALSPSYSCAHEDHALYLSSLGRRSEALEELAKIGRLDPAPAR